ncbi:hypothetical protein G7Y89_g11020 [Cudoniella acicularis]|uniref:Uncharacterized protein n=1 Tax=Cudoniella acicularis TaxID=354080 RepID=A0A8H4REG6_9HELO|nr:hypothetical protein G7Y89_g11020 [Cudoniella acicularis]
MAEFVLEASPVGAAALEAPLVETLMFASKIPVETKAPLLKATILPASMFASQIPIEAVKARQLIASTPTTVNVSADISASAAAAASASGDANASGISYSAGMSASDGGCTVCRVFSLLDLRIITEPQINLNATPRVLAQTISKEVNNN